MIKKEFDEFEYSDDLNDEKKCEEEEELSCCNEPLDETRVCKKCGENC